MILQSKRVWISGQFIPAQIKIEKDKIISILPYNSAKIDYDYYHKRIIPGFIDIHTHGGYGFNVNKVDDEGLNKWLSTLAEEGVTSVLATTTTDSQENLESVLNNLGKSANDKRQKQAQLLGIHLEGPYLDIKNRGAQVKEYIKKPNVDGFKQYQKAANGLIKYMTLAVEHDDKYQLVKYATQNNVVVSIGHSGASYEETLLAIANGAKSFTHTFNGMPSLHHRKPGIIGAAMASNDTFAEIIADGYHVNPVVINSLFKTKPDNMILVSDSIAAKGLGAGEYQLSNRKLVVDEKGSAYIKGTSTLAGSTLKINIGLKNLVEVMLVPFEKALASITLNPARVLNIDDKKGKLQADYDADITILNDDYSIEQVFSLGKTCL